MKLLKAREMRELFKVNTNQLWRWRSFGMPHLRVGRSFIYNLDDVLTWMSTNSISNKNNINRAQKETPQ